MIHTNRRTVEKTHKNDHPTAAFRKLIQDRQQQGGNIIMKS